MYSSKPLNSIRQGIRSTPLMFVNEPVLTAADGVTDDLHHSLYPIVVGEEEDSVYKACGTRLRFYRSARNFVTDLSGRRLPALGCGGGSGSSRGGGGRIRGRGKTWKAEDLLLLLLRQRRHSSLHIGVA